MNVPDNYKIVFIQGGATQQFSMVPLNLLKNGKADYAITGAFSKKAAAEAKKYGDIHIVYDGSSNDFKHIPTQDELDLSKDASYLHICANNTIYGTKYKTLPNTKGKILVSDVSSCFLSEPVNVSDYGIVYGGVQKNIGPAGMAIVIIREDLITEDTLPYYSQVKGGYTVRPAGVRAAAAGEGYTAWEGEKPAISETGGVYTDESTASLTWTVEVPAAGAYHIEVAYRTEPGTAVSPSGRFSSTASRPIPRRASSPSSENGRTPPTPCATAWGTTCAPIRRSWTFAASSA